MNRIIGYSLIISLALYAGTAVCSLAPLAPTAQQLGAAASRGATALGAAASRYRMPPMMRPGNIPATRTYVTIPSSEPQESTTRRGPSSTERSALFRSTQIKRPMGSRPMSTFSTEFKKPWKPGAKPWEVLGVSQFASYQDAQKAYRALIQKVHPDKNLDHLAAATQATQEVNDALRWFKQDPISRMYTTQNSTTSSTQEPTEEQKTQEPTEEQKRKDRESYEYYKKRAGYHSYGYYQQRASNALNVLYRALIATGLVAAASFTDKKAVDWLSEKEKSKDFQKLITQSNELYTDFEKHKFPIPLVEQFTLELEEQKNQATSKINAAKTRKERIDLFWEYNFLLERTLLSQQRILKKYIEDPNWNKAISLYEKAYSEHQKIFENSPRRNLLPENSYKLPQSTNPDFVWSLDLKMNRLEYETAKEKIQQEQDHKSQENWATKTQSYTDWAKSNLYYYWNKVKNAAGVSK